MTRGPDSGDGNNEETMGQRWDKMTRGEEPQAPAHKVDCGCLTMTWGSRRTMMRQIDGRDSHDEETTGQ